MKHQILKQVISAYCELFTDISTVVPCILISFQIEWLVLSVYCAFSLLSTNYELTILKYKLSTLINNTV